MSLGVFSLTFILNNIHCLAMNIINCNHSQCITLNSPALIQEVSLLYSIYRDFRVCLCGVVSSYHLQTIMCPYESVCVPVLCVCVVFQ